MPHVTTAMRSSLRRSVGDIVVGSLIGKRQNPITGFTSGVTNRVSSVRNTFSSWDNCMREAYCKWPVIAAIIIVGLILFSILSCIIRCACCGMSCCCSCFSFLKCCACCGKRSKPHKHLDGPGYPPPQQGYQGYQAPMPMMGGALGTKAEPPQYAQFEVGKNGLAVEPKANTLSEDALPPMPSWETAAKKHVPVEDNARSVELGELDPATGQQVPLMTGAGGISRPVSPGPGGRANGYMGASNDAYHQNPDYYGQTQAGVDPYADPNNNYYGNAVAASGSYGRAPDQTPYGGNQSRGLGYRPPPTRQYSSDSARPLNPGRQDSYPENYQADGAPYGQSRGLPGGGPGSMGTLPTNNSRFDYGGSQQNINTRQSPPQQPRPFNAYRTQSPALASQRDDGYSGYAASTAPPTYASRGSPAPQEPMYQGGYRSYQGSPGGQVPPGGGRGYMQASQAWDPNQR